MLDQPPDLKDLARRTAYAAVPLTVVLGPVGFVAAVTPLAAVLAGRGLKAGNRTLTITAQAVKRKIAAARSRAAVAAELRRVAALPPIELPPEPTDADQFAEIERRYLENVGLIERSRLDPEAKRLLIEEELRVYQDRLQQLLS